MSFFQCLIPKLIRRALKAVTKMKFLKTTKKKKKKKIKEIKKKTGQKDEKEKKKKEKRFSSGCFHLDKSRIMVCSKCRSPCIK